MGWHGVLCCFVKIHGQADKTECSSWVRFPPHLQGYNKYSWTLRLGKGWLPNKPAGGQR